MSSLLPTISPSRPSKATLSATPNPAPASVSPSRRLQVSPRARNTPTRGTTAICWQSRINSIFSTRAKANRPSLIASSSKPPTDTITTLLFLLRAKLHMEKCHPKFTFANLWRLGLVCQNRSTFRSQICRSRGRKQGPRSNQLEKVSLKFR